MRTSRTYDPQRLAPVPGARLGPKSPPIGVDPNHAKGAETCPLCASVHTEPFHRDRARSYWRCGRCALLFVPSSAWIEPAAERARYDQHWNDPFDPGYRRFLSRLAGPLIQRVAPGSDGLDFGCGPGPALARLLEAAGLRVRLYDPFYVADPTVWETRYDFITATEVVEHLRQPAIELDRLFGALRPGGWLGVMTKWVDDEAWFTQSRYIRDPTHIAFYRADTMRWIADRWNAVLHMPATDVALFETAVRGS